MPTPRTIYSTRWICPSDRSACSADSTSVAEQVGATRSGSLDLLLSAPRGDRGMVAAQQHTGNFTVTPVRRLRVRAVLQKAVLVRFLDEALGVADHAGNETPDCFDHRHRGDLAAVEHVIAEAHESYFAQRRRVLEHSLVDALVTAAADDEVIALCEFACGALVEDLTRRRGEDDRRLGRTGELVEGESPGLRLHDHARSPAVRGVIDGAVTVTRPVAKVVDVQVEDAV